MTFPALFNSLNTVRQALSQATLLTLLVYLLHVSDAFFLPTGRHGDGSYWPVDTNLIDRSSLNGKYRLHPTMFNN